MKANELRIGNLVKDSGGKILKIDWFERDKVCQRMTLMIEVNHPLMTNEVRPLTERFEFIEPIPLTEEWLVKFGFKFTKNGSDIWYKEYCFIEFDKLIKCYIEEGRGIICLEHIKYVHQLQNLYFALTGEELTIK
jgi:hypothetical protein